MMVRGGPPPPPPPLNALSVMVERRGRLAESRGQPRPRQSAWRRMLALARRIGEGERESVTNAVPPHLRRDVSSVIQAIWPPRVAVLFQFGRALLRNQRASPGSRSSGNPTDVRPRVAGLVVSQALWICSLQVGRPRSTADLQLDEHFPPPVQLNSIPPDRRNGTLPTELAE